MSAREGLLKPSIGIYFYGTNMAIPLSVWIGLRFTLARKSSLILSFVSLISMLGISLGVLILIVALSVINGSISTLRSEALKAVPHVTASGTIIEQSWEMLLSELESAEKMVAVAPYIVGDATLRFQGANAFVQIRGVDPKREVAVVNNPSLQYQNLLKELGNTDNGIILGVRLASQLGIFNSADVSATALQSLIRRSFNDAASFRVVGFADFGLYGNNTVALVNLAAAKSLFEDDAGAAVRLRMKVEDIFAANSIAANALAGLNLAGLNSDAEIELETWDQAQASLFNALNMEKYLTGFMLLMIVMIGAVNIISTLVMAVSDKSADIAILRTMGASKGTITRIFIFQGMLAGLIGTLIGAAAGVILAFSITDISLVIENGINALFPSANIYLISHLQTVISWQEVVVVSVAALLISFLATIYPAYRASKVQPAEVLRYE
ncbi:MAG: lipoprotein-releasing system permease protein [Pseudohongiellaceae bacterium]|jgi:lipoprotein-releasing system permease protein